MARVTIASLQKVIDEQKGQITVLTRQKNQIQHKADPLLEQIKNQELRNERLMKEIDELKVKLSKQAQTITSQDEELRKVTSTNSNLKRRLVDAEQKVSDKTKKLQALEKQIGDLYRGHLAFCNLTSAGNP